MDFRNLSVGIIFAPLWQGPLRNPDKRAELGSKTLWRMDDILKAKDANPIVPEDIDIGVDGAIEVTGLQEHDSAWSGTVVSEGTLSAGELGHGKFIRGLQPVGLLTNQQQNFRTRMDFLKTRGRFGRIYNNVGLHPVPSARDVQIAPPILQFANHAD